MRWRLRKLHIDGREFTWKADIRAAPGPDGRRHRCIRIRVWGLGKNGRALHGAPSSDKPVNELRIEELNVTLPVYPDGPVTVTLLVRSIGDGPAEVVVTYGACSASTCLPPVRERVIALT